MPESKLDLYDNFMHQPEGFFDHLRRKVTAEELIGDRGAQAQLWVLLQAHTHTNPEIVQQERRGGRLVVLNPHPVIRLTSSEKVVSKTTTHPQPFMLADRLKLYFFPDWWPGERVPHYLRGEEDLVEFSAPINGVTYGVRRKVMEELGLKDGQFEKGLRGGEEKVWQAIESWGGFDSRIFNKALLRVDTLGGDCQIYNYNSSWQTTDYGTYTPGTFGPAVWDRPMVVYSAS